MSAQASGVAVFDTTRYNGKSGWFVVGVTSAPSPMWPRRAAVAGATVGAGFVYAQPNSFFRDITSGNIGASCLLGFDLCSGRGSWVG